MSRSIGENLKKVILFFSNYVPLQIWTLKICKPSRSIGENLKKVILFLSNYLPLQIWTSKICKPDDSKTVRVRSFKLCQLKEDDE